MSSNRVRINIFLIALLAFVQTCAAPNSENLQAKRNDDQGTILEIKLELDSLRKEVQATEENLNTLRDSIEAAEENLNTLRNTIEATEENLNTLRNTVQAAEENLDSLRDLVDVFYNNAMEYFQVTDKDRLKLLREAWEQEYSKKVDTMRHEQTRLGSLATILLQHSDIYVPLRNYIGSLDVFMNVARRIDSSIRQKEAEAKTGIRYQIDNFEESYHRLKTWEIQAKTTLELHKHQWVQVDSIDK